MGFPETFGFGAKKIIARGNSVSGVVTGMKTCWWLKVNTRPVRAHALDGAVFPHIVHFSYTVNGQGYTGSRYVSRKKLCPHINEPVVVYFDSSNPSKCTIDI